MSQLTNFDYNDYTEELLLIPNQWGLLNQLGVFGEDSVNTQFVQFDETNMSLVLVKDQPRGKRKQYNREQYSKLHTIGVPHFPFDDVIRPEDYEGRRKAGTKDQADTLANVRAKKMERIRKSWAATLEFAKMQAIIGNVYNPNGTNDVQNWYTEFGVTQKAVDFAFGTTTTDMIAKIEEALAHSQDNLMSGEIATDFIAICSPEWFSKLIAHPEVKDAYRYYSSSQEPLRDRLTSNIDGRFREFNYGGVRFIENRGTFADEDGNAQKIVPAGEAYLLPLGTTDTFMTYYAPASRIGYVGTDGEQQYMWEFVDERGHQIDIESESNFLCVNRRPQCVVKLHSSN